MNRTPTLFAHGMWWAITVFLTASSAFGRTIYVSQDSRFNGPGTSWGNAWHTIQQAVDVATDGDTVVVSNGVYRVGYEIEGQYLPGLRTPGGSLTNRVVITNNITVISLNGPEVTIIEGAGPLGGTAVRCVYMSAGKLIGFTLTNGHTMTSGNYNLDMRGGGLNAYNGSGVVVSNCIIVGNKAYYGGGGAAYPGTVVGSVVELNTANSDGGGVYYGTLLDCTNRNNSAGNNGGGVYGGVLSNCVVVFNVAGNGGGAYNSTIYDSFIASNSASSCGGGGYAVTGYNCTISSNSASYSGGGVYGGTASNCVLNLNFAGEDGGGACSAALYDSSVIGNSALWNGGGVNGGTISNCLIAFNSAYWGGGAYESALYNCTVSSNSASDGGGCFSGSLLNCAVIGNVASGEYYDGYGGGVFSASAMSNCLVVWNVARYGGGVAWGGLRNSTICTNSADYGGGLYQSTVTNCLLIGNAATNWGGGACDSSLYGCAIAFNSARSGAGASGWGREPELVSCTLVGNSAYECGGGARNCQLTNCIVYYNQAPTAPNVCQSRCGFTCSHPAEPGPGNIDADPQLISISHIAPDSPCRGAGFPAYLATAEDIDGDPWASPPSMGCDEPVETNCCGPIQVGIIPKAVVFAEGYPVTFTADIQGCVLTNIWDFGDGVRETNRLFATHAWTNAGQFDIVLTAYNYCNPDGISATVTVTVVSVAASTKYVWQDSPNPQYPYTNWETAAHTIQDAVDAQDILGGLVLVTNGVYRVGYTIGLDEFPGRVTPGGSLTNRLVITNEIVVRSVNGPEVTLIEGSGPIGENAVRCVYMNAGKLIGFTLTNGHTLEYYYGNEALDQSGGGLNAYANRGAVVSNCVFIGNNAAWGGGGAVWGTFHDCLFKSNSTYNYGGGVAMATLSTCVFYGNSANRGGGAFRSMLFDCALTNNTAWTDGGGVRECTGYRCVLSENFCDWGTYGGGASGSVLYDCLIAKNRAGNGGGASASKLYKCVVSGNIADWGGGAEGDESMAFECVFTNNIAEWGGGTLSGVFSNCVFAFNKATSSGGGGRECGVGQLQCFQ